MRAGGAGYSSPTELSQLLALVFSPSSAALPSLFPTACCSSSLSSGLLHGLSLFLRLEAISCRWSKALLCPRLQRKVQQQSLAQSMLLYATDSCCTVVPKHEKLNLQLWKAGDNSCDPVVQGRMQTQGSASVRCNSLIFYYRAADHEASSSLVTIARQNQWEAGISEELE